MWEMCGPCGAEFGKLSLTDLSRLLKHYSPNPASLGSAGIPCGKWLAFKWDARILTLAELKQKKTTCVLEKRVLTMLRQLCIYAGSSILNIVPQTSWKIKTLTSSWRTVKVISIPVPLGICNRKKERSAHGMY